MQPYLAASKEPCRPAGLERKRMLKHIMRMRTDK